MQAHTHDGQRQMTDWFRSTPMRRAQPGAQVKSREATPSPKNLFSGLFRRLKAEKNLNEIHEDLVKLDESLAKENFLAVTAAYYQLAVEAAVRIKRPDLVKEFEQERDQAILGARSAKPLRQRKATT